MSRTLVAARAPSAFQEPKPSNPLRGKAYRGAAIEFINKWPIGSKLLWDDFATWAYENSLLDMPPPSTEDKKSDEWMAYLQRRHLARVNLNKAATHSDMIPYGGAFSLEAFAGGLIVKSVSQALAEKEIGRRIASVADTKRKQLDYLYQSTDWSQLPPHERVVAESLKMGIDNWVALINLQAAQHEQMFLHFRNRLAEAVRLGLIASTNGGIAGILSGPDE